MSKLRKFRRGLVNKRVKTAITLDLMVRKMGSYEAVKNDFEGALNKTFVQREVEVFAPANAASGTGGPG